MTKTKARALLAFLILAGGSLLHVSRGYALASQDGHAWGGDDAFITYRYAENFARGDGLVFNAGERVEGYSTLLYVLLLSAFFPFVRGFAVYYVAVTLNLIAILGCLAVLYCTVRTRFGEEAAADCALLFSLCPPVWVWVASGMETPLVLLTQLAMWSLLLGLIEARQGYRRLLPLCLVLVAAMIVRADGFLGPLFVTAYLFVSRMRRSAILCGATTLLCMGPYILWRYSYYGYPLPNTYYAKISGPLGDRVLYSLHQLARFGIYEGLFVSLLAFLLLLVLGRCATVPGRGSLAAAIGACLLVYQLYIGGDHLGVRFLLLLFPLGAVIWRTELLSSFRPRVRDLSMLAICLLQLTPLWVDHKFAYRAEKYDLWVELGEFLGRAHPGSTLAIDAAGKVPYLSGLRTIDMLGLNDVHLAHLDAKYFVPGHNKYEPTYILARRPDLIAAWVRPDTLDLFWGLERALWEDAGYRFKYLVRVYGPLPEGNIIDVSSKADDEIRRVATAGYFYAVLARGPPRSATSN